MLIQKLVTVWNKNKLLRQVAYLGLLSVFALISFYLGQKSERTSFAKASPKNEAVVNSNIAQDDLQYCLNDEVVLISQTTEPYSKTNSGIFSEMFKDKNVEVSNYEYHNAKIKSESISFADPNDSTQNIKIVEWQLETEGNLSDLDSRIREPYEAVGIKPLQLPEYHGKDFPILSGYEWNTYVSDDKWLSRKIVKYNLNKDVFINKNSLTMYKESIQCPKGPCGIKYSFYLPSSSASGSHQRYFEVFIDKQGTANLNDFTNQDKSLKKILNTFELLD